MATFFPLHGSHSDHIYCASSGQQRADAGSVDGHDQMKIDSSLAEQMAASRDAGRKFPVIIKLRSHNGLSVLQQRGIVPELVYQNMPGLSASVSSDQIQAMESLPEVELIELDSKAWVLQKH
jgi:hypothetical protein